MGAKEEGIFLATLSEKLKSQHYLTDRRSELYKELAS